VSWAFEHLRALVRHGGATGPELAIDVAQCLEEFDDPASLVMALRRVCAQRPDEAPLWWVCSRVLCAGDHRGAAMVTADALRDDPTLDRLADSLPFPHDDPVAWIGDPVVCAAMSWRRPDLDWVLVRVGGSGAHAALRAADASVRVVEDYELAALGPSHLLVVPNWAWSTGVYVDDAMTAVIDAHATADRGLVVPRGRALPDALANAMRSRLDPLESMVRPVPLDRFGWAVGPNGRGPVRSVIAVTDCPVAPELLRLD